MKNTMLKNKVFVSFDWDNDRRYKHTLEMWDANPRFEFVFDDASSGEINSYNVGRVKGALTKKINDATHTLVIVGKEANKLHKDHQLIGFRNWINFEVSRSKQNRNKLVAVKLDRSYEAPEELLGAGASWAMSFTESAILKALREAG